MHAKTLSAVVWLLVGIEIAQSAPPQIEIPSEIKPTSQYLRVIPKTDAVSVLYIGLDGLEPFPSEDLKDSKKFILDTRGLVAGRYRFIAVASSGTGEMARADFSVVIGDAPPNPGPNPPPVPPPGPVNPLVAKLREAFKADTSTDKGKHVDALSGFYSAMAVHVRDKSVATVGDLLSDYRSAMPAVLPPEAIPEIRKLCGAQVATVVGDDSERKIDESLKTALITLFTELSKSLELAKV